MKQVIINEVIGNDGNLIDRTNNKPEMSPELANMSSKTTDANVGIGRQAANSDEYLGHMGFNFRESDEKENNNILDILAELEFEQYKAHVKYFLDNLNKSEIIKYKEIIKKDFNDLSDKEKKSDYVYAKKTIKALKDNLKNKKTIEEDSDILKKFDIKSNLKDNNELNILEKLNSRLEKPALIVGSNIKNNQELLVFMKLLFNNLDFDVDYNDIFREIKLHLNKIIESKK